MLDVDGVGHNCHILQAQDISFDFSVNPWKYKASYKASQQIPVGKI